MTWDLKLEQVGPDGATGKVNQNLVNFQVTLAFKRFKVEVTDLRITEQEFLNLQYDAIINELIILSNRTIYGHVNTVDFVGLFLTLV